jgi:hypothetical protein
MNRDEQEKMKRLLRKALAPVDVEPVRDLWPAVLRRIDEGQAAPPWFDWALAGGLVALGALFPAAIPMFLYYL